MGFFATLAALFLAEPTARPLSDIQDLDGLPNGQVLYAHWDGDQRTWLAGYYEVSLLFLPSPKLLTEYMSYLAGYQRNRSRHNILAVSAFLHTGARDCSQNI